MNGLKLSEDCLFILIAVSFVAHKFLNLMPFYLFFILLPEVWRLYSTNAFSMPIVRSFMVLVTNKPLIHFNYCLCVFLDEGKSSCLCTQFPQNP